LIATSANLQFLTSRDPSRPDDWPILKDVHRFTALLSAMFHQGGKRKIVDAVVFRIAAFVIVDVHVGDHGRRRFNDGENLRVIP
jgi:hypothetical protein